MIYIYDIYIHVFWSIKNKIHVYLGMISPYISYLPYSQLLLAQGNIAIAYTYAARMQIERSYTILPAINIHYWHPCNIQWLGYRSKLESTLKTASDKASLLLDAMICHGNPTKAQRGSIQRRDAYTKLLVVVVVVLGSSWFIMFIPSVIKLD